MDNKTVFLENISYGNHERNKVDIFIPQNLKSCSGLILFIHGGGWHEGDKSIHHEDAYYFSDSGYVCASMNYRFVADNISVFNELDDITSALETVKTKCSEYGINVEKIILSGGSAGGHLSLLYAYTRNEEAPVTPVAACVYCPPVSFSKPDFLYGISSEFDEWKYGLLSKCCGFKVKKSTFTNEKEQNALKSISPENYVTTECVPTAVFHGKYDELIPFNHILDFVTSLNDKNVKNDLLIYENSSHSLKDDAETTLKSREIFKRYAEMYL